MAGDDVLMGGHNYAFVLDGGLGRDTIQAVDGIVMYDPDDIQVSSIGQAVLQIANGETIDLRASDQIAGDPCIVSGFNRVDASRSTSAVTLTGGYMLVGGSGADTLRGAAVMSGGAGRDTVISGDTTTIFHIFAGDFVRGEQDIGKGQGILDVLGSADFRIGAIEGMDEVIVRGFENVQVTGFESWDELVVIGSNGRNVISGADGSIQFDGRGGDDELAGAGILVGGTGDDLIHCESNVVTGGIGGDTFQWDEVFDFGFVTVTDFSSRDDTLAFARGAYHLDQGMDHRVVVSAASADLSNADLVLFTTGVHSPNELAAFLRENRAQSERHGTFYAYLDDEGHTILHYADASPNAPDASLHLLADPGDIGRITNPTLTDIAVI